MTTYRKGTIETADFLFNAQNGALLVEQDSPSSLTGGIKTIATAATPTQLVTALMPCRFVWIAARADVSGNMLNTLPVFIGESAANATAANGGIPILPANFEGMVIRIDDASKLWITVGANNEGVAYRILA